VAGTILCVDDDRHFCQILVRALGAEGWRVETVHDGERALGRIRELSPALVTLDVMLPRFDGFTVLEILRRDAQLAATPVLLVSGCTLRPEDEARARALGAAAVLKKPVPLDQLLAVVAQHAVRSAEAVAAAPPAPPPGGSFDELPFAALLHHLHGLRASGVLALENGKKKKQLQLRDGIPVAVRSNLVQETLGQLLLASGKITPDVLHESLTRSQRGEGLIGQILVAMHMLDEPDLATALHRQADEKLLEVFGWETGRSQFHPGTRIKGTANTLALKRSPASLVLEGVRTRMQLVAIDRYLAERAEQLVLPGESPFYRYQEVELSVAERTLLERLDGRQRLGSLARGGEPLRRTLYALCVLELVDLRASVPPDRRREDSLPPRPAETSAAQPPPEDDALSGELSAMAERMRKADAFGVLEVERSAGDAEIRTAYADLAKRTHPDRFVSASSAVHQMAEQVFGLVSAAYEAIADGESRLRYLREEVSRRRLQQEIDEGQRAVRAEGEFQKGEAALRARRPDLALAHFQGAVEAYPEEGEYHAALGYALHLTAPANPVTLKKAYAHIQKGRKLAPDRAKPYLYLGRLSLAEGRADVAEKLFGRTVQLDPDCLDALRELRLINLRREKSKTIVQRILRR
jgi:DNA-binding response OmpR family regulator/tetratricopeptide (TPR) repeat protein